MLDSESKEFLKQLQNEMLTQDTFSQGSPRFWVVMQTVTEYDDDAFNADGIAIYDLDEGCTILDIDFSNYEPLIEWLEANNVEIIKKEILNNKLTVVYTRDEEEKEFELSRNNYYPLEEFLQDSYDDMGAFGLTYYKNCDVIVRNTFFLTFRECQEHIERNHYHYKDPHPYAMTAWRSPQVERLFKILEKTNWDEI